MENDTKNTKEYEIGLLLKSDVSISGVRDIIKNFGGEIALESKLNRIFLSYKIKKNSEAFFGYVVISAEPEEIEKISKELLLFNECLRHIIVKYEKPSETAQIGEEATKSRFSQERREKRERRTDVRSSEKRSITSLTNEELEKKLEEILK